MGDGADDAIDKLFDMQYDCYGEGYDGFDNVDLPYDCDGPAERISHSSGKQVKACKRCKVGGLHWEDVDGKWRLYDKNNVEHRCATEVCKRCGKGELHWEKTNSGWRLFDALAIHACGDVQQRRQRQMISHPRSFPLDEDPPF